MAAAGADAVPCGGVAAPLAAAPDGLQNRAGLANGQAWVVDRYVRPPHLGVGSSVATADQFVGDIAGGTGTECSRRFVAELHLSSGLGINQATVEGAERPAPIGQQISQERQRRHHCLERGD